MSETTQPVDTQPVAQVPAPTPVPATPIAAIAGHDVKEVKFNFRENKELGTKRASVSLQLQFLNLDGLIDIINRNDAKEVALVLETLQAPIVSQARDQVDANETITQDKLDMVALSWNAIANQEPAARRGGGIPKEQWEAFVADYLEVMPAVTGKTPEQVKNAATILGNKFSAVKTNKPVLEFLAAQLDLYFTSTPNASEYVDCYEFLKNKATTLLSANDADLLKNL